MSCIRYYYNGESYAYYVQTNSRGDVEALYGGDGIIRVRYIYDSWGNTLSVQDANGQEITSPNNMGNLNPFRYRGYYFDTETGLYYLQSRYYDPETCRFVNGDGYASTGQGFTGNNMFAYCLNTPVQFMDQTGMLVALANSGGCYNPSLNAGSQIVKTMNDCSPAYAVCAGVSLLDGPLPVGDTVGLAGAVIITIGAAIYGVHQASLATKAQEQEKDIAIPTPRPQGNTYYHVTTPENAAAIMATGVMTGNKFEGNYVYAWRMKPNKYAIRNSGAHYGVIISFKTNAAFMTDSGIIDPKVQMYGPVVSVMPGPIAVWDIQIVG